MNENEEINGFDLKPCPLCGGEATIHVGRIGFNSDVFGAAVICIDCNARGPIAKVSLEGMGDSNIYKNYPIRFVGSLAYSYATILREVARELGIELEIIEETPMNGLIEFHSLNIEEP